MELRTLRYLVAVADAGSVTAAARQVRIAQPSLSRQLRQLERELAVDLFSRAGGRLTLTPAGDQFLPIARDLLARADAAGAAASSLAAGRLDRITIAAPATTMTDVVAPFLATLTPRDPFPSVVEHDPGAVYDTLRRGADLAISTEQPPQRYAGLMLAVMPIWLYVNADHAWSNRRDVAIAELVDQDLFVLPEGFEPREMLDRAAQDAEIRLSRQVETRSAEVAQALTAAGRGLAVVSDDSRFGLHGLRILGPGGVLVLRLYAGWDPEHHAAEAIAKLAGRISEFCVQRYGAEVAPVRPAVRTVRPAARGVPPAARKKAPGKIQR